jgi:micrococcal nuclease
MFFNEDCMLFSMKISGLMLAILFVLSGVLYYNWTSEGPEFRTIFVGRVIDGDTIETNESLKIRLKGINTPEKGSLGNDLATEYLEEVVLGNLIEFESHGLDKYDRELGYLFVENENVNAEILRRGLGMLYYYEEDKYFKKMSEAEEYARMNGLGVWKVSSGSECVGLVSLEFREPEKLTLENSCNYDIEVMIKDDATHIYEEVLGQGIFEMETSHIWNDAGDSLYVYDSEGLVEFYRY